MLNPLFHEIFQMTRLLNKEVNLALKKHGLFASQWSVLFCVYKQGELTLTQIWKYLNVEAPTITRTVNRLEQLGWLSTQEGKDRREKIVRLTEEAKVQLPDIEASIIQFEKEFLQKFSEVEQMQLMSLLRKMTKEG